MSAEGEREGLAILLSKARHPTRWEYAATSSPQEADYVQADAILAAGYTRQSRAEIQAEALEEASHFTTDPDVIFGDLADVRDWLRARAQRIREGGE